MPRSVVWRAAGGGHAYVYRTARFTTVACYFVGRTRTRGRVAGRFRRAHTISNHGHYFDRTQRTTRGRSYRARAHAGTFIKSVKRGWLRARAHSHAYPSGLTRTHRYTCTHVFCNDQAVRARTHIHAGYG